ncbi:MAG: hypothetical protein ACHBN1_10955 [Heteroscytonema crispum UTEX LB 1556]
MLKRRRKRKNRSPRFDIALDIKSCNSRMMRVMLLLDCGYRDRLPKILNQRSYQRAALREIASFPGSPNETSFTAISSQRSPSHRQTRFLITEF